MKGALEVRRAAPVVLRGRPAAVAGVLVALFGIPILFLLPDPPFISTETGFLAYDLLLMAGFASLMLLIVRWEGGGLASVGLSKPSGGDLLSAAGAFVLLVGLEVVVVEELREALESWGLSFNTDNLELLAYEPTWSVVLGAVLLVPFAEELAFRGYALERLGSLTRHPWLMAPIPIAVFTWLHVPFHGSAAIVGTALFAVVVTALYLWRRSLVACVLVHMGWNGMLSLPDGLYFGVYRAAGLAFLLSPLCLVLWAIVDVSRRPDELFPEGTRLGWLLALLAGSLALVVGAIFVAVAYLFRVRLRAGPIGARASRSGPSSLVARLTALPGHDPLVGKTWPDLVARRR